MPRMQVYLSEDLYEYVKAEGLPVSELLQNAVRAEMKRRRLLAATDAYLLDLEARLGEPREEDREKARAILTKIAGKAPGKRVS